jgi:hypothetical protein
LTRSHQHERAHKLYKNFTEGQDSPEVRSAVDRYQSALLMPKWLMLEAAERYELTNWPELYRLAEEARVNITNLAVRLHPHRADMRLQHGQGLPDCTSQRRLVGRMLPSPSELAIKTPAVTKKTVQLPVKPPTIPAMAKHPLKNMPFNFVCTF